MFSFYHHFSYIKLFRGRLFYDSMTSLLFLGFLCFVKEGGYQTVPDKDIYSLFPLLCFILMIQNMHGIFAEDIRSGWIDLLLSQRHPLALYVFRRNALILGWNVIALFLTQTLLWISSPMSWMQFFQIMINNFMVGVILSLLSMAIGSLCLGARHPGPLMVLLLFPLGVPTLLLYEACTVAILSPSSPSSAYSAFSALWGIFGMQSGLVLMSLGLMILITPFALRQGNR